MIQNIVYGTYLKPQDAADKTISDVSVDFIVPLDLIHHWKKCSIMAEFMANYEAVIFKNKVRAISILSTIINELLENAVKYCDENNKLVNLSIQNFQKQIMIETINAANEQQANKLDQFINQLKDEDPETLFLQQIENNYTHEKSASRLGILTMIKDYNAQMGIKIVPQTHIKKDTKIFDVHVNVTLKIQDIESND